MNKYVAKIHMALCLLLTVCLCLPAAAVTAKAEDVDFFDEENAQFRITSDEIRGPYYVCTEETDQITFYQTKSQLSSPEKDPLTDAVITWKSGDEWMDGLITIEREQLADGSSLFCTVLKADGFAQTGTAVFTLKLVWQNYAREKDIEMRVLTLPPDPVRLLMPEIDLNIDDETYSYSPYEFGTERWVWSQLQGCFGMSPEIERDWSACFDMGLDSRWYQKQEGIEVNWAALTVTQPGIYQVVAEKTIGNLVLHIPIRVIARGTPTRVSSGDYEYILWEDGTADITAYNGTETDLRIPETLDGHPVYSIGVTTLNLSEFPFNRNKTVRRIVIPGSVKQVTWISFCGCASLEEVVMEEGFRTIGQEAFADCPLLSRVVIPASVTEIQQMAFFNCPSLCDIEVAEGNPRYAMYKHLLYDKNSKEILCACEGSIGESFEVPKGTRVIGIGAFSMNEKLKSVTLPDTLKEIEYYAFADCTALEEVTVPEGVLNIGSFAFIRCASLKSVSLPSTIQSVSNDAFNDTHSDLSITARNDYAENYCKEAGLRYLRENRTE